MMMNDIDKFPDLIIILMVLSHNYEILISWRKWASIFLDSVASQLVSHLSTIKMVFSHQKKYINHVELKLSTR